MRPWSCASASRAAVLALVLSWVPQAGATDVSGSISGTWAVTQSPFVITGSVTVERGTTLVIEPGVQVRSLQVSPSIRVLGTLSALGPGITFHTASVQFDGGSTGTLLECRFEQRQATGYTGSLVTIVDSSPRIEVCTFETDPGSRVDGLSIRDSENPSTPTTPVILRSRFKNLGSNQGNAALAYLGFSSRPPAGRVEMCVFEDCETAVSLQTFADVAIAPRFRDNSFLSTTEGLNRTGIRLRAGPACAVSFRNTLMSLNPFDGSLDGTVALLEASALEIDDFSFTRRISPKNRPSLAGQLTTTRPVTFSGRLDRLTGIVLNADLSSGADLTVNAPAGALLGQLRQSPGSAVRIAAGSRVKCENTWQVGVDSVATVEGGVLLEGVGDVVIDGTFHASASGTIFRDFSILVREFSSTLRGEGRFGEVRFEGEKLARALVSVDSAVASFERSTWFTKPASPGSIGLSVTGSSRVTCVDGVFRTTNVGLSASPTSGRTPVIDVRGVRFEECGVGLSLGGESSDHGASIVRDCAFAKGEVAVSLLGIGSRPRNFGGLSVEDVETAVRLPANLVVDLPRNLFVRERLRTVNGVELDFTSRGLPSGTLTDLGCRYTVVQPLEIRAAAQVAIDPGVVVAIRPSAGPLEVRGRLVAVGSAQRPILFTTADESKLAWQGLRFTGTTTQPSLLAQCDIERGGLSVEASAVELVDCRVSDSPRWGLRAAVASNVVMTRCRVLSNAQEGLRVESLSRVSAAGGTFLANGGLAVSNLNPGGVPLVDASNCYWGNDLGPFDTSDDRAAGGDFNPLARGQTVSDAVRYRPFTHIGPELTGTLAADASSVQSAPIGSVFPRPLLVELKDPAGLPLAGAEVHFLVIVGDAEVLEPQPVVTDAEGRARATVRLGFTPGPISVSVTARELAAPLGVILGTAAPVASPATGSLSSVAVQLALTAAGAAGRLGDVDGDGSLTVADAALAQAKLAGRVPAVPSATAADVNGDGAADDYDARLLLGYLAGLVPGADR